MNTLTEQSQFEQILSDSQKHPVLLCKFSPICPTSFMAQREVEEFLKGHSVDAWSIDVIKARPLSRSIAEQIQVRHESPQAIIFENGQVKWHGSHYDLTRETLTKKLA